MKKIQLGCGGNHLSGWENYDINVDITKTLPWDEGVVDRIFIEHCLEHVGIREAYFFMTEAKRVLKRGGAIRIAVPSVVQIFQLETPEYRNFIQRYGWGDGKPGCGVRAITFEHGHQTWYSYEVLESVLGSLGFSTQRAKSGESTFEEFVGIDSHARVIGDAFNKIETIVVDAVKN